jgi:hypothetical protein
VAKRAVGAAGVTVSGRVARRVVTTTRSARLKGASSFQFTIMLPKAMKKWSRLRVEVRFGGSRSVQAGAAQLVLVRGG